MQTNGANGTPGDLALMRLHVDALFTHDAAGRMLRVNEPGGADAPRIFVGRTAQGSVLRLRHDVGDALARELAAVHAAERTGDERLDPPHGAPPYEALLAPAARTEAGPAYRFPREMAVPVDAVRITAENAELLRPHLHEWADGIELAQPALAMLVDGRAVAVCASVRITPAAHEAGVETAPDFRRRGHAARVVAAWAAAVREMGSIPLYSTSWRNAASQAVARKLGLVRYGTDLHIT
ncbi:MAG TPA: GNAT family N-acetyltransferase [Longimicrobium sp.]